MKKVSPKQIIRNSVIAAGFVLGGCDAPSTVETTPIPQIVEDTRSAEYRMYGNLTPQERVKAMNESFILYFSDVSLITVEPRPGEDYDCVITVRTPTEPLLYTEYEPENGVKFNEAFESNVEDGVYTIKSRVLDMCQTTQDTLTRLAPHSENSILALVFIDTDKDGSKDNMVQMEVHFPSQQQEPRPNL